MTDEFDALPTWLVEFTKKYGITQPVHSLEELTDALLTHFEHLGRQLQPEEAKLLSHLVSVCAETLKNPDSALEFLDNRRVLDQAAWLAKHWRNESAVLYSQPQMNELYFVEPDEPPFASLWTLSRKFEWLAFDARRRRRARESKLSAQSQSQQ